MSAATLAATNDMPQRKPGLWRLTSISAAHGTATFETCIGPEDAIAAPKVGTACSQGVARRDGDIVIVNTTCHSSLGEERISTLFTGDFQTWYRGITKMTFDPPAHGIANLGITVDAVYIGPKCPS